MSSNKFFEYACFLLFVLLTVRVNSEALRLEENYGNQTDCNCIPIRRCHTLRKRRDWRTAGETCGIVSGSPTLRRVCCPKISPTSRTITHLTVSIRADCGKSTKEWPGSGPSIMPGFNVTNGEYPWMVAIRMRDYSGNYTPWCSGFLIDRRHVISAAHCYEKRDNEMYRARVGHSNQEKADEYLITRIVVPASYVDTFYDDIAILTLDREVNFPNFNPICLPDEVVSKMNLTDFGTTVAGWGAGISGIEQNMHLKHLTSVPVISNADCERTLRKVLGKTFQHQFSRGIDKSFLCADNRNGGRDVCETYFTGGPLMSKNRNRWFAVGIETFGLRCGNPKIPQGYTNVTNYLDWIRQNTSD